MKRPSPASWPPPGPDDHVIPEVEPEGDFYWAWFVAYASIVVVLLEIPWGCTGLARPAVDYFRGSFDPVDHHAFVVGRLVMLGPTIIALFLASVALFGRRPGPYRWAAMLTFILSGMWLCLFWFGANFHGGD